MNEEKRKILQGLKMKEKWIEEQLQKDITLGNLGSICSFIVPTKISYNEEKMSDLHEHQQIRTKIEAKNINTQSINNCLLLSICIESYPEKRNDNGTLIYKSADRIGCKRDINN
eukprot:199084_1